MKLKLPFRFDSNYIGFNHFGFHSYQYTQEIRLWRLVWRCGKWNNWIPSAELTETFRAWEEKREASRKGSANPDMPTRGRHDTHLNLWYRGLALLHGRNPFSVDYFHYQRRF